MTGIGTVAGCTLQRRGSGPVVVCLPAFADSARSWDSLTNALAERNEAAVVELPGLNRPGWLPVPPTVTAIADLVAQVVQATWATPVTLVGHSFASAVAVRAARRLDRLCQAVVSIEGNLTAQDAYLTGQAVKYDDPEAFKANLATKVDELVSAGQAPETFARSVGGADAATMWALGLDVALNSTGDGFGHEFLRLTCPTLYLWSPATTPQSTQAFLNTHAVPHRELRIGHHWPWIVDADNVAALIRQMA
jgi:pimeloyl-ACP methyl ester carboxylesterase